MTTRERAVAEARGSGRLRGKKTFAPGRALALERPRRRVPEREHAHRARGDARGVARAARSDATALFVETNKRAKKNKKWRKRKISRTWAQRRVLQPLVGNLLRPAHYSPTAYPVTKFRGCHRGLIGQRDPPLRALSRQKIATTKPKRSDDHRSRETLQHTQPWLPSSPPSLSSRPASPRPRRAPRARSAPPPSTVSRSRSPRYARPVDPSVAEKHRFAARVRYFSPCRASARAWRATAGPRDEIRPAAREDSTRGVPSWRSSPGHPVSRPEGPATGPDPDRSRSGVRRLFPPSSVSRVRRQSSLVFFSFSLFGRR